MQSIWMSNANEENAKKKKCTSWAARVNHKVLPQQGPTQFRLSAHPVTRYTRKVSSSFPTHLRFGFFKVRLVHSATRASHFSGSLVCTQVIFFARALLGSHTFIDLNFSFRVENGIEAKYFPSYVKFIHSEKATKFCEIFTLLLTGAT